MSSVHDIPGEPFEAHHTYDADLEVELELFYAFEPDLEVELELFYATPDSDPLEDAWFGTYDETAPVDFVDDEPTTPWRRFSTWVRNLKRAA